MVVVLHGRTFAVAVGWELDGLTFEVVPRGEDGGKSVSRRWVSLREATTGADWPVGQLARNVAPTGALPEAFHEIDNAESYTKKAESRGGDSVTDMVVGFFQVLLNSVTAWAREPVSGGFECRSGGFAPPL